MVALQLSTAALHTLSTLTLPEDAALKQELQRVIHGEANEDGEDGGEQDGDQPAPTAKPLPQGVIDHALLLRACAAFVDTTTTSEPTTTPGATLDALLRNTTLFLPRPAPFQRSAELEATLARIRLEQEKREYAQMLRDGRASSASAPGVAAGSGSGSGQGTAPEEYDEAREWRLVRSQLSALGNIALSGGAVALAAWWASGNAPVEVKLLVASGGALVIVLAEAFLYARHLEREQGEEKARREGEGGLSLGKKRL